MEVLPLLIILVVAAAAIRGHRRHRKRNGDRRAFAARGGRTVHDRGPALTSPWATEVLTGSFRSEKVVSVGHRHFRHSTGGRQ